MTAPHACWVHRSPFIRDRQNWWVCTACGNEWQQGCQASTGRPPPHPTHQPYDRPRVVVTPW